MLYTLKENSTQVGVLVEITHVVNRYLNDLLVYSVETFMSMVI